MVTVDNKISSVLNNNLSKATSNIKSTLLELSSGKRINKASDDPASAAIVEQLSNEIKTSSAASRNISDAVSVVSIASESADSASEINGRLAELATQSANGTLSDAQRSSLNDEYQSLLAEVNRSDANTSFNGTQLSGASINVQAGTGSDSNSQIQLNVASLNTNSLGLTGQSIATQAGAKAAIDASKNAEEKISAAKADLGATESRLNTAYENLKSSSVNNEAARSSLQDADIAESTAKNIAAKISQQGAASLFSVNNQTQANVIQALLRA